MHFEPFQPAHAVGVKAHPDQASSQALLDGPEILGGHEAFSIFDAGELIAVAGVVGFNNRSAGWILFTDKMRADHFLPIHRRALRVARELEKIGDPLIVHVDPNKPRAVRWAELLGLSPVGDDVTPAGKVLRRMAACS